MFPDSAYSPVPMDYVSFPGLSGVTQGMVRHTNQDYMLVVRVRTSSKRKTGPVTESFVDPLKGVVSEKHP